MTLRTYLVLFPLFRCAATQNCEYTGCQAGERVVPVPRIRPWSNGCSVPPFIQLPDFQFTKCCDLHDTCYMTCGMSKDGCEKAFDKCLKAHCKAAYPGSADCTQTADTFVTGVQMFGCQGYLGSQAESCECVAKDRAPGRFREYVDAFYAAYNRSKTSDPAELDGVLQKYAGKEGQLVYQLYRKYPQSIEIISRNGQDQRTWKTYLEPSASDGEL